MGSYFVDTLIIIALLLLIFVMNQCVHCQQRLHSRVHSRIHRKRSLSLQNPISTPDVANSVSHLPLDPLILLHLCDHMSPHDCEQLYKYLVNKSVSGLKIGNQSVSWTAKPLQKGDFPCFVYLKHWNTDILAPALANRIDKTIYAETLIESGLHHIKRDDLKSWMKETIKKKEHDEINKYNEEFNVTFVHLGYLKPKTHITFEEEEARSLHILSIICFFFFAGVGVGLILYVFMSIWVKPKNYIPLSRRSPNAPYMKNRSDAEEKHLLMEKNETNFSTTSV